MNKNTFRNMLTSFIVSSFVGTICLLIWKPFPQENRELLVYMLGQLSGYAGACIAFYFSTTLGGEHKSELLAQQQQQATDQPSGRPGDPVHVTEEAQ